MQKIVKFICGRIYDDYKRPYGGTPMTVKCIRDAFKDDEDYTVVAIERTAFDNVNFVESIKEFRSRADIFHVDDTGILETMYRNKMKPPDVIGPISRGPLKNYKGWRSAYSADWFYKATVIRLNYSEEYNNKIDARDKIVLIRHGIDTDLICTGPSIERKYVLWAGDQARFAKNFELFQDIMKITKLPPPYEYKIISKYNVQDYWDILDETAILVNTSKYESFCCALFEAKAKGVPTIYREFLHDYFKIGNFYRDSEIQVEYTAEAYRTKILALLECPSLIDHYGKKNREYVLENATLRIMRDDMKKVYNEVIKDG